MTALIPAHNEELRLPATLLSLQRQTRPPAAVWVIADNCTDATADVARANGANVYTTVDNHHRKAGGLNQMLARLLPTHGSPRRGAGDGRRHDHGRGVLGAGRGRVRSAARARRGRRRLLWRLDTGTTRRLQRNEYRRYSRDIARRQGKVFVLTGTATLFRADALAAVAEHRGSTLPGSPGQVYDTISLTEDNELTLALKTWVLGCCRPAIAGYGPS